MKVQGFAVIETATALLTSVLALRMNVLLCMLLYSNCFVLHIVGTSSRHHCDGLIALSLRLLLDCLNGLILLVLLLHEMVLLHLHVLRMLLDLILLDLIACRCSRSIFDANSRLDVVNNSLMCRQLGLCSEAFATVQACMWRIGMLAHMSHQRSLLQELLPTDGALVRYTTVQFSMIHQLKLSREGCTAILTHERIQASVEARMHHQMLFLSKTANETREKVRFGDTLTISFASLPFTASFTDEGSFAGMELHVSHEVSFQGEGFAAILKK